ncbi:leucine-rich repeat domain-containing protein [Pasteurella skyensis]|uniref:Leucine-rich repeat domain-containing protein n=3 Tax=Pasteurellaceae TaxID=712 RepID=A0AAJ6NE77_9PAST|nr:MULTISPECIES: leucine-rich repeat domain-containing protein [Pasteurella]MDP8051088.1 leucine-rich repeat domain-containing protein [Pasteurella atlantica]MDP8104384.1 leucine-rich repeat domain-containing protein [Pasteurella atlantica]MDP8147744.1 leucine-rich repeat domain-containing protein [Pasteurella atlantica]MDP8162954.1 leucine-rich repeat domain-containing protein [Pasteurella skyensis]MDP8170917.1 leucine-rich repeat domain-containing protein [Pasteurella skyensis]
MKTKNYIEITTAKAVGETFSFVVNDEITGIWIDDKKVDFIKIEHNNRKYKKVEFALKKQTFHIYTYGNLIYFEAFSQEVTYLDVINNSELEELNCSKNKLTSLDVSYNKKLKYLDCSENELKTLDVSQNIDLKKFLCDQNNLKILDISNNKKLEWFYCYQNNLENLDLSYSNDLVYFECFANPLLTSIKLNDKQLADVENKSWFKDKSVKYSI